MRPLPLVFVAAASSATVVACLQNSNPVVPSEDGGIFDFDAAGIDVASIDGTVPAPTPEAGADSTVPDSGPGATDAGSVDAGAPDANVADVAEGSPDASGSSDAGPDVLDAGAEAVDAGPDVADAGTVVLEAGTIVDDAGPPQCATGVFGNYYTRPDGTIVRMSNSTVVVIDATGLPLAGATSVVDNTYGACALRGTDQTVWCWASFSGNNTNGQLGDGTFTDAAQTYRATQVQMVGSVAGAPIYLDQVTSIAQGSEGSYVTALCAVRADKTLWCWGPATQGHLWQGTTGNANDLALATQLQDAPPDAGADAGAPITNVDQVSVGFRHLCYLSAGAVHCLGDNTSGELGTGDTSGLMQPYPLAVSLPAAASSVGAQQDQTCALVGGQVYCWGGAGYTSEGNPARQICGVNYCDPAPVQVEVALPDGGNSANALGGAASIFVGYAFACALDGAGQVSCWGALTGTPVIAMEAIPFVNANSATPSGPVAFLSGYGGGGFGSQLNYITTSGALVSGLNVVPQVCP